VKLSFTTNFDLYKRGKRAFCKHCCVYAYHPDILRNGRRELEGATPVFPLEIINSLGSDLHVLKHFSEFV